MDSVFNDIEFLMGIKQETSNSTERATQPLAESVQNNDTDQLAMPTYMTDFILDYINRSLKSDDEESQQENSVTDRENEEESVEDLIQRAENMIRENMENMQQSNQENIPETSTGGANNDWVNQGAYADNNSNRAGQSTDSAPISNHAIASRLLRGTEAPDVITVDTDSDDEVIFVNSHQPPTQIPIIDLSDHSSAADNNIQPSPKRHESRKRNHGSIEIDCDSPARPAEQPPQEKQFRHSCAICLDDVKSPHSTICGHIYCGDCIKNALKVFKKCPSCNKKLKVSNVHPIYL